MYTNTILNSNRNDANTIKIVVYLQWLAISNTITDIWIDKRNVLKGP